MDAKELHTVAEDLFSKKMPLNSLHQEIADNFYPERADFTLKRSMGTDFAANMMSSYPMRCRRELGNQFGTMLRPTARPWFHTRRKYIERTGEDTETMAYLEWFEETQRRAMYDPASLFTRACKELDHDLAAFGQGVMSVELNGEANGLLYRCYHLRDVCWQENEMGKIGFVARKWKPTAQTMTRVFSKTVSEQVRNTAKKTPFEEMEAMHFVVDADMYDGNAMKCPKWSIWYDTLHNEILDATPIWGNHYVIPRWQTVSGVQYSYSPATVCALPDARLLQAMTFTLLEAGEKATSPPIIATQNAVRSDLALFAGGVTWVDEEYDETKGASLRPLEQDFRGFNYGVEMNRDTREMLRSAFFLDTLTIPQRAPEMTAYEVGQRIQEYIRNALPIFEPIEMEYNAAVCNETFDLLWRHGAFGQAASWPKALRGAEIDFSFESPLHDVIEEQKGQKFQQIQVLVSAAAALDPTSVYVPNVEVALRDALLGVGVPARWLNSEVDVAKQKENQQAQQAAQQKLAAMESASTTAKNIGQSGMIPNEQAGVGQRTSGAAP
jgi:hypothetical protein